MDECVFDVLAAGDPEMAVVGKGTTKRGFEYD
jgi:hypothetical protein